MASCDPYDDEISSEDSSIVEEADDFQLSIDSDFEINSSSDSEEGEQVLGEKDATSAEGTFIARSGLNWKNVPEQQQQQPKTLHCNSQIVPPAVKIKDSISTPLDAFNYFITEEIIIEILHCTNLEGRRAAEQKKLPWNNVDKIEIQAFFGLLLQGGLDRCSDIPLGELFTDKYAKPIYQSTMSRRRFEEIAIMLRFDDKRTRATRLETDRLAMVSFIWESFLSQCRKAIMPNENVTIDEQIVPFEGRCKSKQYVPKKASKYGIKIFWMCESETGFALDGVVCIRKQKNTAKDNKNLSFDVAKELVKSIHNSGLNITTDNYFTSVPLAQYLLEKDLTLVGTMRKNDKDIPAEFKEKNRPVFSCQFGFLGPLTLVSYVPKKDKTVFILSTKQYDSNVDTTEKKKPEIISNYNKTKSGVDIMDQKARVYSCKRQTKRWPTAFFYNMLNVAAHNAFLMFIKKCPDYCNNASGRRRIFLKSLVEELVLPNMRRRLMNPSIQRCVKEKMRNFINAEGESEGAGRSGAPRRKMCYLCSPKRDGKSEIVCVKCHRNICNEHSAKICKKCA